MMVVDSIKENNQIAKEYKELLKISYQSLSKDIHVLLGFLLSAPALFAQFRELIDRNELLRVFDLVQAFAQVLHVARVQHVIYDVLVQTRDKTLRSLLFLSVIFRSSSFTRTTRTGGSALLSSLLLLFRCVFCDFF